MEDATIHRNLPPIWELLRAASGLAAIVVLAGIVAGTTLLGEPQGSRTVELVGSPAAPAQREPPRAFIPAAHKPVTARTVVFYLVATQEEAFIANLGEIDVARAGPEDRVYHILEAGTEAELETARQSMMDTMLAERSTALVQVVDLRPVP